VLETESETEIGADIMGIKPMNVPPTPHHTAIKSNINRPHLLCKLINQQTVKGKITSFYTRFDLLIEMISIFAIVTLHILNFK